MTVVDAPIYSGGIQESGANNLDDGGNQNVEYEVVRLFWTRRG